MYEGRFNALKRLLKARYNIYNKNVDERLRHPPADLRISRSFHYDWAKKRPKKLHEHIDAR